MTTLLLSQGVPMIRHGDELGHSQQRQQQRLLPGQRAVLAGLGARGRGLHRLLRRPRRLPAPAPGLLAAPLLRGRAHLRRRAVRHRLVPAGRRGDDGRRLAGRASPSRSASSSTATRCPTRTRAATGSATTASCCCSTRTTSDVTFVLPGKEWGRRWVTELTTVSDPGIRARRRRPGPRSSSPAAAAGAAPRRAPGRLPPHGRGCRSSRRYGRPRALGREAVPARRGAWPRSWASGRSMPDRDR